jgi:hypothetical protein
MTGKEKEIEQIHLLEELKSKERNQESTHQLDIEALIASSPHLTSLQISQIRTSNTLYGELLRSEINLTESNPNPLRQVQNTAQRLAREIDLPMGEPEQSE